MGYERGSRQGLDRGAGNPPTDRCVLSVTFPHLGHLSDQADLGSGAHACCGRWSSTPVRGFRTIALSLHRFPHSLVLAQGADIALQGGAAHGCRKVFQGVFLQVCLAP